MSLKPLDTVKIVSPISDENPLGFVIINASDLCDDHELFDEPTAKMPPAKAKK